MASATSARFKIVNDSAGHAAGDQMLVEVARGIEDCLDDCSHVARFGGDEFLIVTVGSPNPIDHADQLASRIHLAFVDGRWSEPSVSTTPRPNVPTSRHDRTVKARELVDIRPPAVASLPRRLTLTGLPLTETYSHRTLLRLTDDRVNQKDRTMDPHDDSDPDAGTELADSFTRRMALRYGSVSLLALAVGCSSDDSLGGADGSASMAQTRPSATPEITANPPTATATPPTATPDTTATPAPTIEPAPTAVPTVPATPTPGTTVIPDCTVYPAFTDGPFYVSARDLVRSDVTEQREGAPTFIRIQLADATSCEPLGGLPVDIWSASAEGLYSGVDNSIAIPDGLDTQGTTYMRGRQVTDSQGIIEFETLYPGWYPVTPPHYHFTAPFDEERSFTWQFFLDDDFSDAVYTTVSPYSERGVHPVRVGSDRVDAAAVITPTGSVERPVIDMVVGIDLDSLGRPAAEVGTSRSTG